VDTTARITGDIMEVTTAPITADIMAVGAAVGGGKKGGPFLVPKTQDEAIERIQVWRSPPRTAADDQRVP